jgi:hypothetical protein
VKEKYCWLVAGKPSEQAEDREHKTLSPESIKELYLDSV